jgi:xylulose-5-phosphate/fructose-6-phosphate phosphoketolase
MTEPIGPRTFYDVARYASLAISYLRSNFGLSLPVEPEHLRPRPLGHWGCTSGVAFVWAALLEALRGGAPPTRLLIGTGHAGPAWLGAALAEGAAPNWPGCIGGLKALSEVAAFYGAPGGGPTDLGPGYPGMSWCSGELGHAVGVAQGLSWADGQPAVCVIGDGELEAASTLAGLIASGVLSPPPVIVINHNGLRMGGQSLLGSLTLDAQRRLLTGLGHRTARVTLGDFPALSGHLSAALGEQDGAAGLIVVEGLKGDGCPPLPDGEPVAGTVRAHKAPMPHAAAEETAAWVDSWLRPLRPAWLPDVLDGEDSPLERWLPAPHLRLTAPRVRTPRPRPPTIAPASETSDPPVGTARVVTALSHQAVLGPLLVTSPDELGSNRLGRLAHTRGVTVAEMLNEELCVAWTVGSAVGGRPAWHAAYEAFATLAAPLLLQHLKFLDALNEEPAPASIGVLLTSLGWRNVPSHRDSTIHSALLSGQSPNLRLSFPVCAEEIDAHVRAVSATPGRVHVIVVDKSVALRTGWQRAPEGRILASDTEDPLDVLFVVIGDVLAREVECATSSLAGAGLRVGAVAVEELTTLYRSDLAACATRDALERRAAASRLVYIAAAGAGPLAVELVRGAVGGRPHVLGKTNWDADAQPGLDLLVRSECAWFQMARRAAADVTTVIDRDPPPALPSLLRELDAREDHIRQRLGDYDLDDWHVPLQHPATR